MKKFFFFLAIVTLTVSAWAQDTVRYGDPWYAFNPMPVLEPVPETGHWYPYFQNQYLSDFRAVFPFRNDNYVAF